jgi:hypothetical protein
VTAVEALKAAKAVGVSVEIDGDDLLLEAPVPPPPAIVDALSRYKAAIVALLRPASDEWTAEDWLDFYEERAGVAEFDGNVPRSQAEARAFACCIAEWLNRNPTRSTLGRCNECGGADRAHDRLLPFGTDRGEGAWLHLSCWPIWLQARQTEAIAALSIFGIPSQGNSPDDFGKIGTQ